MIFSSISIFSKNSYQYFVNIDILTINVNILSKFQKMPIYWQSISIFLKKNMKKGKNLLKKLIFYPKCPYPYQYFLKWTCQYRYLLRWTCRYRYWYFPKSPCQYRYWYRYFSEMPYWYQYFFKCRYIDNRYPISIYPTGLGIWDYLDAKQEPLKWNPKFANK